MRDQTPRRARWWMVLLMVLALVGCEESEAPEAAAPAAPAPTAPAPTAPATTPAEPEANAPTAPSDATAATHDAVHPAITADGVLGVVSFPSAKDLGPATAVIDAVQPGFGVMASGMFAQTLKPYLGGPDAIDDARPVRFILVAPEVARMPLVAIVHVKDAAKLEQAAAAQGFTVVVEGAHAMIGQEEALALARPTFDAFRQAAPPVAPLITAYVPSAMTRYKAQLEQLKDRLQQQPPESESDAMVANSIEMQMGAAIDLLTQVERVDLTLERWAEMGGVQLAITPVDGSTLAAFTAAQKPSDFAMLDALPLVQDADILMAGDVHAGEAHARMLDFQQMMLTNIWQTPAMADTAEAMKAWAGALDGRMAFVINMRDMPNMRSAALLGIDGEVPVAFTAFQEHLKQVSEAMNEGPGVLMGARMTVEYEPEAFEVDGVKVTGQVVRTDLAAIEDEAMREAISRSTPPVKQTYTAPVDGALLTITADDPAAARALVESSLKGGALTLSAPQKAAFDAARESGDSALMTLDIKGFINMIKNLEPGADMSALASAPSLGVVRFGAEDGRLRLYIGARP